uniref:Uncharacterized protein n=1 Tax=Parastrongyloides trichosuri TaxID=131310 RepID=A0A0N4Z904_PARTI
MEQIQNKIHVVIFLSVFIIFIYLLLVSQNNKLEKNKFDENSLIPISFNGILNTRYIIWKDKKIILCSEDDLLPNLFKIAFGNGEEVGAQDKFIKDTLTRLHSTGNSYNGTWKLYTIIQNPLDRFSEIFIKNCLISKNKLEEKICYGCMNNPTCVVNYLYKNLKELISLEEHFYSPNEVDRMFMPYYWRCNLQKDYRLYQLLNFTNPTLFNVQLQRLFHKRNTEKKHISLIMNQIKDVYESRDKDKIHNELKESIIERLFKDRNALLQFVNIYYSDYQNFNFIFPHI